MFVGGPSNRINISSSICAIRCACPTSCDFRYDWLLQLPKESNVHELRGNRRTSRRDLDFLVEAYGDIFVCLNENHCTPTGSKSACPEPTADDPGRDGGESGGGLAGDSGGHNVHTTLAKTNRRLPERTWRAIRRASGGDGRPTLARTGTADESGGDWHRRLWWGPAGETLALVKRAWRATLAGDGGRPWRGRRTSRTPDDLTWDDSGGATPLALARTAARRTLMSFRPPPTLQCLFVLVQHGEMEEAEHKTRSLLLRVVVGGFHATKTARPTTAPWVGHPRGTVTQPEPQTVNPETHCLKVGKQGSVEAPDSGVRWNYSGSLFWEFGAGAPDAKVSKKATQFRFSNQALQEPHTLRRLPSLQNRNKL